MMKRTGITVNATKHFNTIIIFFYRYLLFWLVVTPKGRSILPGSGPAFRSVTNRSPPKIPDEFPLFTRWLLLSLLTKILSKTVYRLLRLHSLHRPQLVNRRRRFRSCCSKTSHHWHESRTMQPLNRLVLTRA